MIDMKLCQERKTIMKIPSHKGKELLSPHKEVFLEDADCLLLKGDCVKNMSTIPSSSISLLLTDPPYNLGLFMKVRGTNMGKLRENHFAVSGWDQLETEV